MDERKPLKRITINPQIFGGKPIIRGRRIAVEHILGMFAAGSPRTLARSRGASARATTSRRAAAGSKVQRLAARWDGALADKMAAAGFALEEKAAPRSFTCMMQRITRTEPAR